jgi:preprotein translocase subunit SecE
MDAKLNQSKATEASAARPAKTMRFFAYVQALKEELRKVSWTTKKELKFATKAVIGATFVLGISIYLADLVIKGCLDFISFAVHYIFG